jgi:hypothetical protein
VSKTSFRARTGIAVLFRYGALEWYVIVLIFVEILLSRYQLFHGAF